MLLASCVIPHDLKTERLAHLIFCLPPTTAVSSSGSQWQVLPCRRHHACRELQTVIDQEVNV